MDRTFVHFHQTQFRKRDQVQLYNHTQNFRLPEPAVRRRAAKGGAAPRGGGGEVGGAARRRERLCLWAGEGREGRSRVASVAGGEALPGPRGWGGGPLAVQICALSTFKSRWFPLSTALAKSAFKSLDCQSKTPGTKVWKTTRFWSCFTYGTFQIIHCVRVHH
jgi:hypothetical protein